MLKITKDLFCSIDPDKDLMKLKNAQNELNISLSTITNSLDKYHDKILSENRKLRKENSRLRSGQEIHEYKLANQILLEDNKKLIERIEELEIELGKKNARLI
jgi:DNA repair ATPase RecN